jgi:uncharacterized membrane protein
MSRTEPDLRGGRGRLAGRAGQAWDSPRLHRRQTSWHSSCNLLPAGIPPGRNGLRSSLSDPFTPTLRRSFGQRLRSWFFTGLVVFGPIAVTGYIAWWVIDTIDNWVRPWLPNVLSPEVYLPFHVPGFGVLIAIVGLTLLGFLTANFVGRSLVRFGEGILDRTPLIRGIYKGLKQVFETVFSQSGSQFRKVGLVQFPAPGSWSIVFISSAPPEIIASALPERKPMISAFMPCTPNPTTGYSFYILLPTK